MTRPLSQLRRQAAGPSTLRVEFEGRNDVEPGWPCELEIGFGKGRYLLRRAAQDPNCCFVGIEVVKRYYKLLARRAQRRRLTNLRLLRGEALFLLATRLPRHFARAVHVYFPDPWPKARHHKRRLFDPETVDLVLGALQPRGVLYFATDHLAYAHVVRDLLADHPGVELEEHWAWPEGPRTNYEAKYEESGRSIVRLTARRRRSWGSLVHPACGAKLLVGPTSWPLRPGDS